jgi:hypothetical protein
MDAGFGNRALAREVTGVSSYPLPMQKQLALIDMPGIFYGDQFRRKCTSIIGFVEIKDALIQITSSSVHGVKISRSQIR